MDYKKLAVELFTHKDYSAEEFCKLDAFKEFENNPDIIANIEKYHLPEITTLICHSNVIMSQTWAVKYKFIQSFVIEPKNINLISILNQYNCEDFRKFENDFLSTTYKPIIDTLYFCLEELRQKVQELQKRIQNLEKKLETSESAPEQIQTKFSENLTETDKEPTAKKKTKSNDNRILAQLQEERDNSVAFMKNYASFFNLIDDYHCNVSSNTYIDDENINREQAYSILGKTIKQVSKEELFVNDFMKSGFVKEEYYDIFNSAESTKKVLKIIGSESYKNFAFPFICRLYELNLIDITIEPYVDFIQNNISSLIKFLIYENPSDSNTKRKLYNDFLNLAIKILFSKSYNKNYISFFNSLEECDTWEYIICLALQSDDKYKNLAYVLNELTGKPLQIAVDNLLKDSNKLSLHDICEELFKISVNNSNVILKIIGQFEQSQRKMQRKLNSAERRVKSQSQEIFSALYRPVEDLEDITVSIKDSKYEVKSDIIAAKLLDIVVELREGLSSLGIETLEEIDVWKYRTSKQLDLNIHKALVTEKEEITKVRLRTLGFEYCDEEGTLQKKLAEVCNDDEYSDRTKKNDAIGRNDIIKALYTPICILENTATSIRYGDRMVDNDKMVVKLSDIIQEFRNGLSILGIESVEKFSSWKSGGLVKYDEDLHIKPESKNDNISDVRLKSLGFSYIDENGEEHRQRAEVFIDMLLPENPKKKGEGYPKGVVVNSKYRKGTEKKLQERQKQNRKRK